MTNRIIEDSCGNIFADLNVKDAEEMMAKAKLAEEILAIIERRKLTQQAAAKILETDQSYISKLKKGSELKKFSFDRLLHWLNRLDREITVTVRRVPKESHAATWRVVTV